MLVLSKRILQCPVMSLQTGRELGETVEAIIDPRQLIIVALRCEGPGINFRPALLHTNDIREFSSLGIIINSSDNLMPPDDLVRLQEVLDFRFQLIDKPVMDELGNKLGKVSDYTVETRSFYISQLHVRRPLLKSFGDSELIVQRTQIIGVTDKQITVKAGTAKSSPMLAAVPKKTFENPFRKVQPETSSLRGEERA